MRVDPPLAGHRVVGVLVVLGKVALSTFQSQVDYQGNVTLLTQAIYMSKCTMDVTYYPFDVQMCELKFASWSTEVSRVGLKIFSVSK